MRIIGGMSDPHRGAPAGDERAASSPAHAGPDLPPARPRRRKKPYVLLVAVLALILTAGLGVPYVAHALLNPWAISLTGRPTLTGHWNGLAAFAPGDRRQVVLNLRSAPRRGPCSRCSPIDGDVKVCAAAGATTHRLTGDVQGRHARRFSLSVTPGDRPGDYLRWLNGEWAGGDQVRITATLVLRDPDGAIRSDHQPAKPVVFAMSRGTGTATC